MKTIDVRSTKGSKEVKASTSGRLGTSQALSPGTDTVKICFMAGKNSIF